MVNAIFLDRDGVFNKLVYREDLDDWGAPWTVDEIELVPRINTLVSLLSEKYLLFVVSNQPDAAKGYTTYENLMAILHWFEFAYEDEITEFYWCLHHPSRCQCKCRKPGTWSVERAIKKYDIDVANSYFIGDRDIDIECGQAVGLNTIKVSNYDLTEVYNRLL